MRDGFSAIRGEIKALDEDLRAEMHALHHLAIEQLHAGNAETQRHMRVLVEELVSRMKTIGEGPRTKKKL